VVQTRISSGHGLLTEGFGSKPNRGSVAEAGKHFWNQSESTKSLFHTMDQRKHRVAVRTGAACGVPKPVKETVCTSGPTRNATRALWPSHPKVDRQKKRLRSIFGRLNTRMLLDSKKGVSTRDTEKGGRLVLIVELPKRVARILQRNSDPNKRLCSQRSLLLEACLASENLCVQSFRKSLVQNEISPAANTAVDSGDVL